MSRPTTSGEFLDLVRASDVLDARVLDGYVNQSHVLLAEPVQLARSMIREGVLTAFQAEQFLLGKSRLTLAGKYNILDRLATGGMGIVLLCEHKHMRRLVALKVLPSQQAREKGCLERFYREARAVAQVHHPNIVTAHDIDQDGKYHFIVMEYVDGFNLQHIVEQHRPMDVTRACHYIAQAAQGLQHAHEMGLVHRDIKPANLLLDRSGTVKILDLGLARFFHDTLDNLTEKYDSGTVLGTADYLSPDQALNSHGADIRSDIYSLGVTLYYLLAGKTPFADGDTARKLIAQLMRIPKPIRQVRPEVPEGLERILRKMTAKGPDDRYQTPEEVVEALAPPGRRSRSTLPRLRRCRSVTRPCVRPGPVTRAPWGAPSTACARLA
jgi:serine/threonine protein kinase